MKSNPVRSVVLFGPIVGGPDFVIEITVSPGNFILGISMPGASIELLEPWGGAATSAFRHRTRREPRRRYSDRDRCQTQRTRSR